MSRISLRWLLVPCLLLAAVGTSAAQVRFGEPASDFPPGTFADGKSYSLADFHGGVVVLYFFEAS
jgi:hypothetical protein